MIASDSTTESLVAVMADQGERMMIADAEGEIFGILRGRYSNDSALGVFLRAHTDETFTVDRKGSGSTRLVAPALTVCVATQASAAEKALMDERFIDKGLVARLEFAYPESVKSRYRRGVHSDGMPVPAQVRTGYNNRIGELVLELWDSTRKSVPLDDAAQLHMRRVVANLRKRQFDPDGDLGGTPELETWAAKSAGRVARRALHLHIAEHGPRGVRPAHRGRLDRPRGGDRGVVHREHEGGSRYCVNRLSRPAATRRQDRGRESDGGVVGASP
ncbi:DUF3987 domain-containing protein [Rhodococcus kroppenstedtii]|uniref:DUF3987 domain-containing protein n=2 Tax=Mycobacteriales TaxID=85007 RepID=A0ABS7NP17_9NOCA|nr:DUF3987 domain-containing protein [Rhodococcus kroppenstedtii]MBY6319764.1 DUF3987 domain-containing protein [Rhodococcus kroppenstedtii]MBY6398447.1 DUF3987 domain-containing protein [Rhodococcus kroppenstedtii]